MSGAIRLEDLPDYNPVPQLSVETITAESVQRLDEKGVAVTGGAEDPLYRNVGALSYREVILRFDKNEADRNKLLAYATDAALDHIGVTYHRTPRLPDEGDQRYRRRIELAPEARTVAGTRGAYIYHALSANIDVKDVEPITQPAGVIDIVILANDGEPSNDLLNVVSAALSPEDVRPMNDTPNVIAATVIEYQVTATLRSETDITNDQVETAKTTLQAYVDGQFGLKKNVVRSGIDKLHVNGIDEVVLHGWQDIVTDRATAAKCTGIHLTTEVIAEV